MLTDSCIHLIEITVTCYLMQASVRDFSIYFMKNIFQNKTNICENIIACPFSVHNTISLSRHEQVSLIWLRSERYFSHHQAMQMIMLCIFKGNMRTWTETKLMNKKLCNVTN